MDFNAIIKRVVAILTKPIEEWEVIKNETMSVSDMFLKYAIVLVAIPAIAAFIGYALIGISMGPFGSIRLPIVNCLIWAVIYYVIMLAGAYVMGMVIDALAPSFGAAKEMIRSMKVAVFSSTAAWVAGIFFIIPGLYFLTYLGALYGIYLFYLGLKSLKEVPQDKLIVYLIVTIIISGLIMWLGYFIAGKIAFSIGFSVGSGF
jgi:hypothetical protein